MYFYENIIGKLYWITDYSLWKTFATRNLLQIKLTLLNL